MARATPTRSSASSETTRITRRAVAIRNRNDRAGGRLRRISRSVGAFRAATSDSTDFSGTALHVEVPPPSLDGRDGAGSEGERGVVGADVLVKRDPISLLTTPQSAICRGQPVDRTTPA